jgi:uncharacterized protein (TIGR03083 family)
MPLTDDELFSALDDAVAVFAALPRERAGVPVPACPDWTLAELFEHQARVHRWATQIVTTRPASRPPRPDAPLPAETDRWDHLAEGAAALRAALRAADLDEPVWTFAGPRPARWWLRRQVHETTVHAVDGAEAVGRSVTVAPPVAVDGVDELFEVFVPGLFDAAAFGAGGESAHLHATDAPGEWLLRFTPEGVTVTHEHARGDVAARGPAADLLRLVWGRVPGDGLTVFGDATILDRYRAATRI